MEEATAESRLITFVRIASELRSERSMQYLAGFKGFDQDIWVAPEHDAFFSTSGDGGQLIWIEPFEIAINEKHEKWLVCSQTYQQEDDSLKWVTSEEVQSWSFALIPPVRV